LGCLLNGTFLIAAATAYSKHKLACNLLKDTDKRQRVFLNLKKGGTELSFGLIFPP
jgi:hypothetical protein